MKVHRYYTRYNAHPTELSNCSVLLRMMITYKRGNWGTSMLLTTTLVGTQVQGGGSRALGLG